MHLLDLNALIALAWAQHDHHAAMQKWFRVHAGTGWFTCAFTQAGFVRILCQTPFAGRRVPVDEAANLLRHNTEHPQHRFVDLNLGFDDVHAVCTGGLVGHRQITDAYLLATAIRQGARLLTFDAGVRHLLATDAERARHVSVLKG